MHNPLLDLLEPPLSLFLIAQPGKCDVLAAFPGGTTAAFVLEQLRQNGPWPRGFRIGALDVGCFEIGEEGPSSNDCLPTAISDPVAYSNAAPLRTYDRILWRITVAGKADLLIAGVPELTREDALRIARVEDANAQVNAAHIGAYRIQRVVFASRPDSRWLDEQGFVHLEGPAAPRSAALSEEQR